MKTGSMAVLLFGLLWLPALCGADKRAKTEDGREVILREDGTWSYANEFKKDPTATEAYKGKRGTFALHLVPDTWKKIEKPENEAAEVAFDHKSGDAGAIIIAGRIEVPLESLRKFAVENVRALDKDAKVIEEEKRVVNGREVLAMVINTKADGVALTYYGYYFSGDEGSIQVISFTGTKLFKEFRPDMEAFLNGFVVIKK